MRFFAYGICILMLLAGCNVLKQKKSSDPTTPEKQKPAENSSSSDIQGHIVGDWELLNTELTDAAGNAPEMHALWTGEKALFYGDFGNQRSGIRDHLGVIFDPKTKTWQAITHASDVFVSSVTWTRSQMFVWGNNAKENIGALFDPTTNSWKKVSTFSPPPLWDNHTAVWTGSDVIIWGGHDGYKYLDSGAIYNPANDSWKTCSSQNAPTARYSHTAIWTGEEMIIWGGLNSKTAENTGARYNPSKNTWTSISTENAPSPRYDHVSYWTGKKMLIWGGSGPKKESTSPLDLMFLFDGGLYDPKTDTWETIPSPTGFQARNNYGTAFGNSHLFVWGGHPAHENSLVETVSDFLDSGAVLNIDSGVWKALPTTNAPKPRAAPLLLWVDNALLVWGGYNGYDEKKEDGVTTSWERKMSSGGIFRISE